MLSFFQVIQLVSFSLLMSCGQILFKKTALSLSSSKDPNIVYGVIEGFVKALSNPWLYSALTVYAIATCFWLYILQRIPLSQAYPFTAIAMIIVPIFSFIIFGDKLSYSYWMGALLIISGIIIIAR